MTSNPSPPPWHSSSLVSSFVKADSAAIDLPSSYGLPWLVLLQGIHEYLARDWEKGTAKTTFIFRFYPSSFFLSTLNFSITESQYFKKNLWSWVQVFLWTTTWRDWCVTECFFMNTPSLLLYQCTTGLYLVSLTLSWSDHLIIPT